MQDARWAIRVLSGEDHGATAATLRALLAVAEPVYAQRMNLRNWAYNHRLLKSHPLPRPTMSVGNLTTGGTGKTPIIRWLADQVIARGLRPAILTRGYRSNETGGSDEAQLLAEALGGAGSVIANPDRVAGAMSALSALQPDVFLLDDAFQHRRVRRDLNIVLVDACEPFGFGHVLPRGLLREPMRGLRRADAVIITRYDLATPQQIQSVQAQLRRWVDAGSVYLAQHTLAGARAANTPITDLPEMSLDELSRQRFFAFAGIANPGGLHQQLQAMSGAYAGFSAFSDHHAYTARDLASLRQDAASAGAKILLTTEKDWVKIRSVPGAADGIPIWRLDLRIDFHEQDQERLLKQVMRRVQSQRGNATTPATPGPWRG